MAAAAPERRDSRLVALETQLVRLIGSSKGTDIIRILGDLGLTVAFNDEGTECTVSAEGDIGSKLDLIGAALLYDPSRNQSNPDNHCDALAAAVASRSAVGHIFRGEASTLQNLRTAWIDDATVATASDQVTKSEPEASAAGGEGDAAAEATESSSASEAAPGSEDSRLAAIKTQLDRLYTASPAKANGVCSSLMALGFTIEHTGGNYTVTVGEEADAAFRNLQAALLVPFNRLPMAGSKVADAATAIHRRRHGLSRFGTTTLGAALISAFRSHAADSTRPSVAPAEAASDETPADAPAAASPKLEGRGTTAAAAEGDTVPLFAGLPQTPPAAGNGRGRRQSVAPTTSGKTTYAGAVANSTAAAGDSAKEEEAHSPEA